MNANGIALFTKHTSKTQLLKSPDNFLLLLWLLAGAQQLLLFRLTKTNKTNFPVGSCGKQQNHEETPFDDLAITYTL